MSSPNTSFNKMKPNPKDISIRQAVRQTSLTHTSLDTNNKRLKEEIDELRHIIEQQKINQHDLEVEHEQTKEQLENAIMQIGRMTKHNIELNSRNQELQLEYEAAEVLLKESSETMKLMRAKLDIEKQTRLEQTQKATSLELRLVELSKKAEESYSDSYRRFIEDYNNSKKPNTVSISDNNLPPAHKAIEQLLHMEEITYQRKLKLRDTMKDAVNQLCDRLVELEHVSAQVEPMLANNQEEALSPVSSPLKEQFGSPSFRYPISDLQLTESIYENENRNNGQNHIEESMMTVESDI